MIAWTMSVANIVDVLRGLCKMSLHMIDRTPSLPICLVLVLRELSSLHMIGRTYLLTDLLLLANLSCACVAWTITPPRCARGLDARAHAQAAAAPAQAPARRSHFLEVMILLRSNGVGVGNS